MSSRVPLLLLSLGFIFATACSTQKTNSPALDIKSNASSSSASENKTIMSNNMGNDTLTQYAAMQRSSHISNTKYKINVALDEVKSYYTGDMTISFTLTDYSNDLRVDYKQGKILNLKINGKDEKTFRQSGQAFFLPSADLKEGSNTVLINYQHEYDHEGVGFHRFQDPKDHAVYLYTMFEPNDAARFMPCFDQPDIKGVFSLSLTAPQSWQIVSSNRETSKKATVDATGKKVQAWVFPETPPMSSYLFSLIAGPYKVWEDRTTNVPLRILARNSMAKYIDTKEWFAVMKQGLSFYGKYFDYQYPFKKLDQIVVPEFNKGAMENIAAVTFSERYISRGKMTEIDRERLASVILHEMAHMWFGDLVTMKWWDDLWLNESFATFMSTKAMVSATRFKTDWIGFYMSAKAWAYATDQLSTTHPIKASINSADEAYSNFDGITYGKGASVLKQLNFLMGDENFKKGLQAYFRKFEYKNSTLNDFIAALSLKTGQDLSKWKGSWLMTSRPDNVSARFSCEGGRLSGLDVSIHSTTPQQQKTHAFDIAFAKLKDGKMEVYHHAEMRTATDMHYKKDGVDCPDIVFPNYQDYGYFTVDLDPVTLENTKKHLALITDPLLRTMLWDTIWQMTRDQKIPIQDYMDVISHNLISETDSLILNRVVRTVSGGGYSNRNSIYYFLPNVTLEEKNQKEKYSATIEKLYLEQAKATKPGSDRQQLWVGNLVTATETPDGMNTLVKFLSGTLKFNGLISDPDRRWAAIERLCSVGDPRVQDLLAKEKNSDNSDRAKNAAIGCEASEPKLSVKKTWWSEITADQPKYSFRELNSAISSIFIREQKQTFGSQFSEDYFKFLREKISSRQEEFQEQFTDDLTPLDCTLKNRTPVVSFIDTHPGFAPVVMKTLKELVDNDERCEKIKTLASSHMIH